MHRAHLNALADQLMTHEAKLDVDLNEGRHGFLWQRTIFDQMHPRWKHCVEKLFPPVATQDSISRLREALLPWIADVILAPSAMLRESSLEHLRTQNARAGEQGNQ